MSEEAFSVILWACSAYAAVTPAVGISNRCCPPSVPRSHIFSDFNYSPQFPFKSLIRLLLISPRCRSARVVSSCRCQSSPRIGGHQLHGTGQHRASGGQERRTDPTVETSVRLVARPSCAPSCSCPLNAGTTRRRRYVPPLGGGATAHRAASTLHLAEATLHPTARRRRYGSRRGLNATLRGGGALQCGYGAAARRWLAAQQRGDGSQP